MNPRIFLGLGLLALSCASAAQTAVSGQVNNQLARVQPAVVAPPAQVAPEKVQAPDTAKAKARKSRKSAHAKAKAKGKAKNKAKATATGSAKKLPPQTVRKGKKRRAAATGIQVAPRP
jgi:hypothetical protein